MSDLLQSIFIVVGSLVLADVIVFASIWTSTKSIPFARERGKHDH